MLVLLTTVMVTMIVVMSVMVAMSATPTATFAMMMAVTVLMMMTVLVVVPVPMLMPVAAFMIIGSLFRAERTFHSLGETTLPPGQFLQFGQILHIESRSFGFESGMPAAELPGQTCQPQRIFRGYFQQPFRCGFHNQQTSVFQLESIAIIENNSFVRRKFRSETALSV